MRKILVAGTLLLLSSRVFAQFDIMSQPADELGPWSDVALTTLTVPQVVDGSITLDGKPGSAEYGGFEGVEVTPGENAWILDFPGDRQWDDPDDSSFTFWLAHDTDFLYVGVDAKDDVVTTDDPNDAFWKDDAIEIVTDVWNDNYDNNTDNSNDAYGGHNYVNFEGRFSSWDDDTNEITNQRWSSAVDWTYGEEGDIFGFGEETDTGWNMEVRFHKRLFEDPEAEIELVEGAKMGFNIGIDDDDGFGPGENGDGSRTQDLEIQYFWANRERFIGWNEAADDGFFTEEEIAQSFEALANGTIFDDELLSFDFDWGVNSAGRLSHGGAGEIIFGGLAANPVDCNGDGDLTADDLACTTADTLSDTLAALNLIQADFDGSGEVDFDDFVALSNNFNNADVGYPGGDANLDGTVDFDDFVILSNNFNQSSPAGSAVPEPPTWSGLGIGVLAVWLRSRRRQA